MKKCGARFRAKHFGVRWLVRHRTQAEGSQDAQLLPKRRVNSTQIGKLEILRRLRTTIVWLQRQRFDAIHAHAETGARNDVVVRDIDEAQPDIQTIHGSILGINSDAKDHEF